MSLINLLKKPKNLVIGCTALLCALLYAIPNVSEFKDTSSYVKKRSTKFWVESYLKGSGKFKNSWRSLGRNLAYKVYDKELKKNELNPWGLSDPNGI
ncbi:MAG: hypothetical protein AABW50_02565 [Nanoarchaeota archaeon]